MRRPWLKSREYRRARVAPLVYVGASSWLSYKRKEALLADHRNAGTALAFLIAISPSPATLVLDVLKFAGEILPLQAVNNFVGADHQAHVGPIAEVAADCNRDNKLPSGKFLQHVLQQFYDVRMQHLEVANTDLDLRPAPIVAVD